jgi:hypothetical protein
VPSRGSQGGRQLTRRNQEGQHCEDCVWWGRLHHQAVGTVGYRGTRPLLFKDCSISRQKRGCFGLCLNVLIFAPAFTLFQACERRSIQPRRTDSVLCARTLYSGMMPSRLCSWTECSRDSQVSMQNRVFGEQEESHSVLLFGYAMFSCKHLEKSDSALISFHLVICSSLPFLFLPCNQFTKQT